MERPMIAWNLPNWITVVLMAAVGYAVLTVIAQLIQRRKASAGSVGG